jgi:hypothetical protein
MNQINHPTDHTKGETRLTPEYRLQAGNPDARFGRKTSIQSFSHRTHCKIKFAL